MKTFLFNAAVVYLENNPHGLVSFIKDKEYRANNIFLAEKGILEYLQNSKSIIKFELFDIIEKGE